MIEGPLGLPAEEGDQLGPDDRFEIQSKLGFGMNSSVWLANDRQTGSYVALKILTGYATDSIPKIRYLRELRILQPLQELPLPETKHCNSLITHSMHKGTISRKTHPDASRSLSTAKCITRHILQGLVALYSYLKPDDIMLSLSPQLVFDTIEEWVKSTRDVHEIHASAQEVQEQTTDEITPLTLRPPKVILGGPWSEKWTSGRLVAWVLLYSHVYLYPRIRSNQ
ncbi:hypothetical protein F5878DRAFT_644283 [Lentinula raphanica]|uniref:Protein kinase domain-containing protein n=1 Tax=Lentinula raphanica TaxID=153919 RepID=A0AA38UAB2_9AGAR|nr:hypothetical protein F5878DRAFT_644283 [Lentinula raphanica]